jgi:hypothetical protein
MPPPVNIDPNIQKNAWWGSRKATVHQQLHSQVAYLKKQNRGQREDARFFMELASNFNVSGNGVENYGWMGRAAGGKMRRNLTASACDTAASLILQNRTVPQCVTRDGDFALSRLAERWTRAIQGQFYSLGVFELAPDVGMDALQTGTGHVYGYVERTPEGPRPCLERVLPNEILVDCVDGQYRSPRSMYRLKLVSREVLIGLYPKLATRLRASGGPDAHDYIDMFIRKDNRADFVAVTEAWHLPTSEGAGNGRHVICTDNCDLVDEPFTKMRFPIRTYRYVERRLGYWGQGLVERVMPAQVRLSEIQQAKRDMQRLCSNAYWVVQRNSDVQWDDMTNMPGQVLEYQGAAPPQMVTFSGTPADLSQEEAQIVQEVFENEGFANSVSGGEVNKGLSSARAVRAADDVASRRHVMPTRLFEQLYEDVASLIADLNDECAEIDPQYTVTGRYRSGGKSWMKKDLWTDLKLPEGDVEIGVFPISALPTTPAGLWSQLEELTQAGMVSKSASMELMNVPDIDQFTTFTNSSYDFTTFQIDRMFDGHAELPVPYQNLQEASVLVNQALLVALRMEAPEEIVVNFDAYLSHCKTLMQGPPPAPAAMDPAALNANAMNAAQLAGGGAPPPMPGGPAPMPVAA